MAADTALYSKVNGSEELLRKFLFLRKMFTHASRITHADMKIILTMLIHTYFGLITNLINFFNVFISLLYMFRTTQC
jgi:hypothetical protein